MSQANVKYVGQVSPDFLLTYISTAASTLWAISQKRVPFTHRYWNDYVVTLSCHLYKAFRKAATNQEKKTGVGVGWHLKMGNRL